MKSIVIGAGEIGNAVADVISRNDEVILYDKKGGEPPILRGVDILHICFPFEEEDKFLEAVNAYFFKYKPEHLIIWSTVPVGTTNKIPGAVHSPVEGRHPLLATSIRYMARWIGANNESEGEFFKRYFQDLQMRARVVPSSDYTEFLKLRSTAKYGLNIIWTAYEAEVAKEIGMDFEYLKDFDTDYNKLYRNLDMDWAQRYVLDPPKGKIGGHCVVPNAKLLDSQFPSELLKMIRDFK